jgi:hypothetical protein
MLVPVVITFDNPTAAAEPAAIPIASPTAIEMRLEVNLVSLMPRLLA